MKKIILSIASLCVMFAASATEKVKELEPLTATYIPNAYTYRGWSDNWFLTVKGGISAFVGTPEGHGDLFDRTEPLVNADIGKWFNSHIGARLSYQGINLVDCNMKRTPFQSFHLDLLWNIIPQSKRNHYERIGRQRWMFGPYFGTGIIRNSDTENKPFALSYGFIGQYSLTRRLQVSAEIGGSTTWRDFDGHGGADRLGDNLFHASIGLSVTIGKSGWDRVIDATPYVYQNDLLINQRKNESAAEEVTFKDSGVKNSPQNNYSGLNSLRERMKNKSLLANDSIDEFNEIVENDSAGYAVEIERKYIGAPIYFFFKLGSGEELTEPAQIINIKEIAKIANKNNLAIHVVGAADSQTGTPEINEKLSILRADYIARMLRKEVKDAYITTQHLGGVETLEPFTGNRNSCVILYFKE